MPDYREINPGRSRRMEYERSRIRRINTEISNRYLEITRNFIYELSEPVGLLNKKLVQNTKIEINYIENNFCVICQQDIYTNKLLSINNESIIRILRCSHCFHVTCIDRWFIENNKCPTCKSKV
jgi:hypothetical protein